MPYGLRWISLAEASKRSNIPGRTLRQRCGEIWFAAGKARMLSPFPGMKARWHVREDVDAAFMPAKFPEQMTADFRKFTADQRRVMERRKLILDGWHRRREAATRNGEAEAKTTAVYLADVELRHGVKVSRTTLYEWESRYRKGGTVGLVDGRHDNCRRGPSPNDPFIQEVQRLYLLPRKLTIKQCRQSALASASENGWQTRSYKSCTRFLNALPRAVVLRWRGGKTEESESYIERDYSTIDSNSIWCGDHHRLDVMVAFHGKNVRPWLTAWQDLRSRKIVGWQLLAADPNTDAILAAFADGARSHGIPEKVYIDNGKDYDSYALQGRTKAQRRGGEDGDRGRAAGTFASMGIESVHAKPYHGQSKPIERFFGTVADAVRVFETYCGNSAENKPHNLQEKLKKGKAPTLATFVEWFGAWLETYHATAHTGDAMDGRSPAEVFNACLKTRRTCDPAILDLLLLKQSRPVKVTRNGVRYEGILYGINEPALVPWEGKQVIVLVDPKNVTSVIVMALDGKFICRAQANARLPFNATAAEIAAAHREKDRRNKAVKEYVQQRPHLARSLEEDVIDGRRLNARPDPEVCTATDAPIRTAFEDQLPALRRALKPKMQLAVGAEGMSHPLSISDREFREAVRPAPLENEGPDSWISKTEDAFSNLRELLREERADHE